MNKVMQGALAFLLGFTLMWGMQSCAHAQTGTAQTKGSLNTETTTNFPDNSSGLITPAITRQSLVDYIASWEQAGRVRANANPSDALLNTDTGFLVNYSNAGAIAVSIAQATGNFGVWDATVCSTSTGTITVTPTTSTINGQATVTIPPGGCTRIFSDGTNYQTTKVAVVGGNGIACTQGATATTSTCAISAARATLPTTQVFTSGTDATYTTPANVLWIEITLIGGGGGGGAVATNSGTVGNPTCWNTSGTACSTPVYQAGGGGAGITGSGTGGAGGTISGSGTCNWTAVGGGGGGASQNGGGSSAVISGGTGGNSSHGGGGAGTGANAGGNAGANTGGGGGGGGQTAVGVASAGGGGGAGATCYVIIGNPAATYKYTVGASANGGAAGGNAGGNGSAGLIVVVEHYGS